jgi:hypothetical protein
MTRCPRYFAHLKAHAKPNPAPLPVERPTDPALRELLLEMAGEDQRVRLTDDGKLPSPDALAAVDARNLPRLTLIVATGGFPSRAQVGSDGVGAAWLLLQHATGEPGFQARMLPLVEAAVHAGELSAQSYALTADRVLRLHARRPQRYGSQLDYLNGRYVPAPIDDAANVDARRAALGMPPLADYVCVVNALHEHE